MDLLVQHVSDQIRCDEVERVGDPVGVVASQRIKPVMQPVIGFFYLRLADAAILLLHRCIAKGDQLVYK